MDVGVTASGLTGLDERSPETQHFAELFALVEGDPVATLVAFTAAQAINELPDGPELTAGLRKLLEASDCLTRAHRAAARER